MLRSYGPLAAVIALVLSGCERSYPPPPRALLFDGLPVSGSRADAERVGFTRCTRWNRSVRCRRADVMLRGVGPFEAAVELAGSKGQDGFDHLILWHHRDQTAVQAIDDVLRDTGWARCLTGTGHKGDQAIYTRKGAPVRMSMDLSYWMKRRVRVFPGSGTPVTGCGHS